MLQLHQKGGVRDERRVANAMRNWIEQKSEKTNMKNVLPVLPFETTYKTIAITLFIQRTLFLLWLNLYRSVAPHAAHHVKKCINVTSSKLLIREDIPGQSSYIKTSTWKFWRTFAHLQSSRSVLITLLISQLHIF